MQAVPGEEPNMVMVPRWEEREDDSALEALVDALLAHMGGLGPEEDVRQHTRAVQEAVAAAAAQAAAERAARAACNSEEIDLLDDDATPAAEQAGAGMQELMFSREPEAADHQQLVGVNAHCQDKLVLA